MQPPTRLLRTLAAATMAVSLLLAGGSGRVALANGVGDLYVADPQNVDEIYLKQQKIEMRIPVPPTAASLASNPPGSAAPTATPTSSDSAAPSASGQVSYPVWTRAETCTDPAPPKTTPAPTHLAFTIDGKTLYAANGTTDLYAIRVSDLCPRGPITTAAAVTAIAHPKGSALYIAMAETKMLSVLSDGGTTPIEATSVLATADILAADPREPRLIAAKAGEPWIAILDAASPSGKPVYAAGAKGLGGKVVAVAIARAEGYAWIAESSPNRVYRIELATGHVTNTAVLDGGAPTAITAIDGAAIVSVGADLFRVRAGQNVATKWATADQPILQLASDLNAGYVYTGTASAVAAINVTTPLKVSASVPIPGAPTAFAAIPNGPSTLPAVNGSANGGTGGGPGNSNGTTNGSAKPHKTHAPPTDTISDVAGGMNADITSVIAVLAGVVVVVTVGSHLLIKRLIRE
jgi:hypothetical protein